jgi:7-cyano-7-deazaguanine synthase
MKMLLIYSGGMDSSTLLYDLVSQGHEVSTMSFNYKQRHSKELRSAKTVADLAGVPWELIDLSPVAPLLSGSSQSDLSVPVPVGRYDEPSMKQTVVPNRNMIMLSIASAAAIARKLEAVVYGAHAGDHAIYPDCREPFIEAMSSALRLCDWHPVTLLAPYVTLTKGDICKRGLQLNVPFADTWTCYVGDEHPCGQCGACTERAEAFAFAKANDPLT